MNAPKESTITKGKNILVADGAGFKIKNPKRIILELTNSCNLKCIMCARNHIKFDNSFLTLEFVKKLKEFYKTAEEVTLFGYGESLLNKEFPEILSFLSSFKGLRTYLVTNGLLLDKYASDIVKNQLTYLSISVDAATQETYKKIRGAKLNDIFKSIEKMNALKRKFNYSSTYIRFIFVAMKDNISELPLLVDIAKNISVSEIKVEYLVVHHPEMIDQTLFYNRELLYIFKEAELRAKEKGIKITLPSVIGENMLEGVYHKECSTPFDTMFVSSNGDVRACMISNEIFGSILTDSPEAIWNGEGINSFRSRVNSENPPEDCKSCWQASHLNVNREDAHIRLHVNIAGRKE